ncbi:MAG: hypothetical protein ABGW78_12405 [Pirellulales bacterium]
MTSSGELVEIILMGQQTQVEMSFGFLTAVESSSHGVFGGYLLVDAIGRPIEFHCTTPVKVSRAQQILYGASLSGHLHGQQIGAALLAEATTSPILVLTDQTSMLSVCPHTSLPVALVCSRSDGGEVSDKSFDMGDVSVTPHFEDGDNVKSMHVHLKELGSVVELQEPFERIRAAIEEAQRH